MIYNPILDFDEFNHEEIIKINYNGILARIYLGQKRPIMDMGYIFLNSEDPDHSFSKELPPILIPADPDDNRAAITLRGAIYSPELVNLSRRVKRMIGKGTFKPGPIEFP